jgi:tetratricopeptide (TPR) repeat protein
VSRFRASIKIALMLALCVAAGASAGAACVGPQTLEARIHSRPSADAYTQLGMWFGERHQYACAVESFRAGLQYAPDSARVHYLLGLTLYTAGKPQEAVDPLQKSVQLDSTNLDSHLILGAVLTALNRNADAAAQWEAALKIDPSSKVALDGLSKCLIAAGQYDPAIALLSSTPRDENMTLDLAIAQAKAGNLDQAGAILEKALRADPSSVPLTNALVTVYVGQRRIQEAVNAAKSCAELRPKDLGAQALYLHVLIVDARLDQARPLARKLLAAAPGNFDALYLNGILEREAGQYATARTHLEKAVALNPSHANARYNLGMDLVGLKDYRGAREQLEKSIQLGTVQPSIRFELATVLRDLGEMKEAQKQLQIYQQELRDKANRTLAASKSAQGDQEVAKGNMQSAAELYREAVAALPKDAYLEYKLALILDSMGDDTNERAALEKAIQIDPDFALAQYQLGYLDSRGGDLSSAEKHFRSALQAAPGYTKAWISLAATLAMESQFAEAQKAVAIALRLDPQDTEAQQLRRDLTAAQARQ